MSITHTYYSTNQAMPNYQGNFNNLNFHFSFTPLEIQNLSNAVSNIVGCNVQLYYYYNHINSRMLSNSTNSSINRTVEKLWDLTTSRVCKGLIQASDLFDIVNYIEMNPKNYRYDFCLKKECEFLIPEPISANNPIKKLLMPLFRYQKNSNNGLLKNTHLKKGLLILFLKQLSSRTPHNIWNFSLSCMLERISSLNTDHIKGAFPVILL